MQIAVSLISGLMFGFEGIFDEDEPFDYIVIDVFLIRITIATEKKIDDSFFD